MRGFTVIINALFRFREQDEGPWDRHVQDALIEKCNENGAKILHVYVDTKSAEVSRSCYFVECFFVPGESKKV